jgi:hypothetical protein
VVRGDSGASDFEEEDNEPLPIFEESRDKDTAVRPELEPDKTDIGNGVDGATWILNMGIGIGNGMSIPSLPSPFAVPLPCTTLTPPKAGPRTGVVAGVGWGEGPGVGFTTTARGSRGGVVGEDTSIATSSCGWRCIEGDGLWVCSVKSVGSAVRISSDWAGIGK